MGFDGIHRPYELYLYLVYCYRKKMTKQKKTSLQLGLRRAEEKVKGTVGDEWQILKKNYQCRSEEIKCTYLLKYYIMIEPIMGF